MTCQHHPTHTPRPGPHTPDSNPSSALFGTLFAEIIMPDGQPNLPALPDWKLPDWELPDWEVRVWPVARLGDATVEARARFPHLTPEHLRLDLQRAGITILGPVREKR